MKYDFPSSIEVTILTFPSFFCHLAGIGYKDLEFRGHGIHVPDRSGQQVRAILANPIFIPPVI